MFPFDQPFNDLTFENRNKTYGAYVIRREYSDNLKIALLTAVGFVGLLIAAGTFTGKGAVEPPAIILPDATQIMIDPPVVDPPKKIEQTKVTPPTDVEKPVTKPLTTELQATDEIQKTTQNQNLNADPVTPDPGPGSDSGNPGDHVAATGNGVAVTPTETAPPAPLTFAEEMPDVEGGILKFVARHLRYPDEAKENNKQGIVVISFVVEKDGSITDISPINEERVGYGCEEEAIRVIKSGKWKPGKNNGHALRVRLTMPVKYKLQ
ncbi:MAG TPA: TonB family protein [Bacteroidia bacterium]|jgi:protein TonB|nr:TonB family protein [Bacteroidia bacterium]